jgi:hypothetical protein
MAEVRLTKTADRDFGKLAGYSDVNFGTAQTVVYLDGLRKLSPDAALRQKPLRKFIGKATKKGNLAVFIESVRGRGHRG